MKNIILASMTFILIMSCNNNTKKPVETKVINGGVVQDDPKSVAQVTLIESSSNENQKGRKVNTHKDSDGDGVADYIDDCPGTIWGYKVDIHGCQIKDTVQPPPPPVIVDQDNDGTPDSSDDCKLEPGPITNKGCPVIITPPPPPSTGNSYTISMPPADQQKYGECVAFATVHAWGGQTSGVFSPAYLYNHVVFNYGSGIDCGNGTSMQIALDFLISNGVCTWNLMPYTGDCVFKTTTIQDNDAAGHKIASYSKIAWTDRAAIKAMIASNRPVIITVLADDSFVNAKTGFVWKTFSGSGNLPHTITICGYDDSKNAYKVMNSWGTTWGDAGFSWIDYDFIETGGHTAGNGYCYVINN